MASFTFDGASKLIICAPGTTAFHAQEVYSRWKEWAAQADNAKWLPAFENSVGGNEIGGGVRIDAYLFITNGWRIQPQAADHRLVVEGNLLSSPITAPVFARPEGNFLITIERYVTNRAVAVLTGGSSGSGASAEEIAQAVWATDLSLSDPSTAGESLQRAQQSAEIAAALSA